MEALSHNHMLANLVSTSLFFGGFVALCIYGHMVECRANI